MSNQVQIGGPQNPPPFDFKSSYDQDQESKFLKKSKDNPFIPAGIAGALIALGYAAVKFRSRGNQKASVFLIHTRVAAQGAIVGALTVGCIYQIFHDFVWKPETPPKR